MSVDMGPQMGVGTAQAGAHQEVDEGLRVLAPQPQPAKFLGIGSGLVAAGALAAAVEADLADLAVYEALLAHRGVRGLVVCCDDCQQDHYHDWDMLRANLLQLLVDGTVRPHEPAYDPEPEAYVTWDYCRGYADASLNGATPDPDGFRR